MNKIILLLVVLIPLGSWANTPSLLIPNKAVYQKKILNGLAYFSKIEPSACHTKLVKKHNTISFSYVCDKNVDVEYLESMGEIVNSFHDIVQHYSLQASMQTSKYFQFQFIWKVEGWPVVKSINNNKEWPNDFNKDFNFKHKNKKDRFMAYRRMLREAFLKADAYLPLTNLLKPLGCNISLNEYFLDPIYIGGEDDSSRKKLVSLNVFSELTANKSHYPFIHGWTLFNIDCPLNQDD
jgi:hypothetical protein